MKLNKILKNLEKNYCFENFEKFVIFLFIKFKKYISKQVTYHIERAQQDQS